MMKHPVAAVVFSLLASVCAPVMADGALPVSASSPPILTPNASAHTVSVSEDVSPARPELLGALAIGVYALLKSRSRRIV